MKPKGGHPPRDGLWVKPIGIAENTKLERILMSLAAAYVIASFPAKTLVAGAGAGD
jgi:hypothetical protein